MYILILTEVVTRTPGVLPLESITGVLVMMAGNPVNWILMLRPS